MKWSFFTLCCSVGLCVQRLEMPPRRVRAPVREREVRVFDTRGSGTIGGTAWANLGCDEYINNGGTTVAAYTDACLIPSARGSGYGEIQVGKYNLLGVDVRVFVEPSGNNTQNADILCRFALIEDMAPNLGTPSGPYGFQDWSDEQSTLQSFPAWGAAANARYRVLDEWMGLMTYIPWVAGGVAVNSISGKVCELKYRWPQARLVGTKVGSDAATPSIAKLSNCNVFLAAIRTTVTGSTLNYYFTARAYYYT